LVTLVTLPEKPVKPPITFDANEETLFTTEAAKAEPGMVGSETVPGIPGPEVDVDGTEVGLTVEVDGRGALGS
jgi:hypothetical protein